MARRVSWTNNSSGHLGTYVYRAPTLDPLNLPAPVATVDPVAQGAMAEWIENASLDPGGYDYAVQDFDGAGAGALSAVSGFLVGGTLSRDSVTIALVADSTSDQSSIKTEQALVDAGFLLSNITRHADATAPPSSDIIVICRGASTQAKWDLIKPAWDAGTPVIFGSPKGSIGGGNVCSGSLANLTGLVLISGSNSTFGETIENNTHPITDIYPLGEINVFLGGNYGHSLDTGEPYVGTLLATGDTGETTGIAGKDTLIAVPAGTPDLLGNQTPTKAVVWTNLYGKQQPYSTAGSELLGRCIDWCLS